MDVLINYKTANCGLSVGDNFVLIVRLCRVPTWIIGHSIHYADASDVEVKLLCRYASDVCERINARAKIKQPYILHSYQAYKITCNARRTAMQTYDNGQRAFRFHFSLH